MSKLKSILAKLSRKLNIPFEEKWLYEGELLYPIHFKTKHKETLQVYGTLDENGDIKYCIQNLGCYDTIEDCIQAGLDSIKERYGTILDVEIGNPELIKE